MGGLTFEDDAEDRVNGQFGRVVNVKVMNHVEGRAVGEGEVPSSFSCKGVDLAGGFTVLPPETGSVGPNVSKSLVGQGVVESVDGGGASVEVPYYEAWPIGLEFDVGEDGADEVVSTGGSFVGGVSVGPSINDVDTDEGAVSGLEDVMAAAPFVEDLFQTRRKGLATDDVRFALLNEPRSSQVVGAFVVKP